MIYINDIYNNICCFVSNITYFSPYEFINTIKNIPSVLFNSKNNLISNIYTCFDINKIFGVTYKPKNIQNTEYINLNFKKRNHCEDNDIEDNCDWGWFIVIDEYELYKR